MSVLIKGMEMPKNCSGCDAEEYYENSYGDECGFFCPFGDKAYTSETRELKRLDNCPLVAVPPHGRLIDADEISKHKYATIPPHRKEYADGKPKSEDEVIAFKFGWNNAIDAITYNAPTVIEADEGET